MASHAIRRSLDHRDERLPFFDDIRGELRRVAIADVRHPVDHSGRDEKDLASLVRRRRLALDLILQRAFEDIDDLFARMRVLGGDISRSKSTRTWTTSRPGALRSCRCRSERWLDLFPDCSVMRRSTLSPPSLLRRRTATYYTFRAWHQSSFHT
jgi:hypothetical protein